MKSYTFSEARQNFAAILEQARRDGAVRIQRRDGQSFVLTPEPQKASPLDIPGVQLSQPLTREDILESIQESRRSFDESHTSEVRPNKAL
ncbi:MAG: type II toxin-antitoxin system Phd/YefM family antitoxin [Kouleothrix sp.]|jgi:PHD/YefM family antitoxin component YafN of YafNO toxin-antitoxin module|nr:type II toxin-antitoxin system Phd/YefM family antitoxin [Kouleothrix sp.]